MKRRPRSVPAALAGGVHVIGGIWRNTRLSVLAVEGLRPTPNRVRETLFNWLAPWLPGAHVLDLFAGSGALGIEAVSRGARHGVLVERHRHVVDQLSERVDHLRAHDRLDVIHADALTWLNQAPGHAFNLVFCDPPFGQAIWPDLYAGLSRHLAQQAIIYVESPVQLPAAPAEGWQLYRQGRTTEVHYALYRLPAATLGPSTPQSHHEPSCKSISA